MNLGEINARRRPGRAITGMAAVLLPFNAEGEIAEDAYMACLRDTVKAGLTPAVNMDTGYVNLLTDIEKERVLKMARQALGGMPFVAGAYIEGQEGDVADLYRREIARIAEYGGTPILFQTARLHHVPVAQLVATYARAVADVETAYAFELGKMFAPSGEIWTAEVAEGILSIPQIKGMKHSSLDRVLELERLALRDRIRPDFKIFTGNDLGIDMIEYGSDYLLGLAAFAPEKFAERDRLWRAQDTGYFTSADGLQYLGNVAFRPPVPAYKHSCAVFLHLLGLAAFAPEKFAERDRLWRAQDTGYFTSADGLQYLGNVAFRPPVPAYKHSCAVFLHLLGKIPTDRTHPRSPVRPHWEREILADCAQRLGLL